MVVTVGKLRAEIKNGKNGKNAIEKIDSEQAITERLTKDRVMSATEIKFVLYGPIPDEIRNTLAEPDKPDYKKDRDWAHIIFGPIPVDSFYDRYLNPENVRNVETYKHLFSEYITNKTVNEKYINNGNITFASKSNEFKYIYSTDILNNPESGTYTVCGEMFREKPKFNPTKLLPLNWDLRERAGENNLRKNPSEKPAEGIDSFTLNPKAAQELQKYYETWANTIGLDFLFRDANNLSLAIKVYGPGGFYPIWRVQSDADTAAQTLDNKIIVNASELENIIVAEKQGKLNLKDITCENNNGPRMFKILPTKLESLKSNRIEIPTFKWDTIQNNLQLSETIESILHGRPAPDFNTMRTCCKNWSESQRKCLTDDEAKAAKTVKVAAIGGRKRTQRKRKIRKIRKFRKFRKTTRKN